MVRKLQLLTYLALILFSYQNLKAQETIIEQDWVKTYSSQDSIYNQATAIDVNGNVYVTGFTYNSSTQSDITTIKYSDTGTELWVQTFNGTGNKTDRATGISFDSNGNIYVCGLTTNSNSNSDFILIKYNDSGVQQWIETYDNNGNDKANSIVIDDLNNIYVTGFSEDTDNDFLTIKYDQNGNQIWNNRKNFGSNDRAQSIEIYNNNLYISGTAEIADYDFAIISYSLSGAELWSTSVTSAVGNWDFAKDLTVNNNGVFVTGYSQNSNVYQYFTVNYSLTGVLNWRKQYRSYGNWNIANSICSDNFGNIYIVGSTRNANTSTITTVKYDQNGNEQWLQNHYMSGNIEKYQPSIICDNDSGIYIAGTVNNGNADFITIKYDYNGNEIWTQTYNGNYNGSDVAADLTIDANNNIYVTGQSYNGNNYDFCTIKYTNRDLFIPIDAQYEPASGIYTYKQNKGQVKRTDNIPANEVKFYCQSTFPSYYIQNDKLSYVFSNVAHTTPLSPDSLLRIDMVLQKTRNLTVKAFEPINSKTNYFLEHIPEGRTSITGYKRIVSPNVYNKIDLHYYSNNYGFKYYFVVNPNGNDNDIQFKFNGADNVSVTPSGGLKIETAFGNIEYEKAWVYRIDQWGNEVPMISSGNFNVDYNGNVTISVSNYPSSSTLVIAVTEGHSSLQTTAQIGNLDWSTYHTDLAGGGNTDMGLDICNDEVGNTFTVGKTGRENFPATTTNFYDYQGGFDAYISKFDELAEHKFTTFYGGDKDEDAFSVVYNKVNDKVYFTGTTTSNNIVIKPSTNSGAYNQNLSYAEDFNTDAYIAKFNKTSGLPEWSSYFAGNENDEGRAISCDDNGNVYITGNTFTGTNGENGNLAPTNGGLAIYNAYDNSYNGNGDIYVAKFNTDDQLVYSTFFGGSELDRVFDLDVYSNVSIQTPYFVGSTESTDFPNQADALQFSADQLTAPNQKTAFITNFDNDGNLDWSTLFPRVKEFQTVTASKGTYSRGVYAVGITDDMFDTPIETCEYNPNGISLCNFNGVSDIQPQNNGQHDIFITKFVTGGLRWSTFYGGNTNEFTDYTEIMWNMDKYISSAMDNNGNFYVAGVTTRNTGDDFPTLPTLDYYLDEYNDGIAGMSTDMFLLGYNQNNQIEWSTLFGGGNDSYQTEGMNMDIVGGLSTYKDEYLHLTAWTKVNDFPDAHPGTANAYYHPAGDLSSFYTPMSTVSRFGIIEGVGVKEIEKNEIGLNVYPNPANNTITVDADINIETYTIINNVGQVVKTEKYSNIINISYLPTGFYMLQVNTKDGIYNTKFIKE